MPSLKTNTYRTSSSEETKRLGEKFAAEFLARDGEESKKLGAQKNAANLKKEKAAIIILSGELGAGKTTFVQGFLKGAGIRGRAPSPTFVIMRHYRIPGAINTKIKLSSKINAKKIAAHPFSRIIHMDAYRLQPTATKNAAHLSALNFNEIISDPKNIVLIEWGERIKGAIPKGALRVQFRYDKKEGVRVITVK
jgi:tRNA threonylcarbamoyladenosine biosynthesis protein TsaE